MDRATAVPRRRLVSRLLTLLVLLGVSTMLAGGCGGGSGTGSPSAPVGTGSGPLPPAPPGPGVLDSAAAPMQKARYHPGRLLLKMRTAEPDRSGPVAARLSRRAGVDLTQSRSFPRLGLFVMELRPPGRVEAAVRALEALPEVEFAEPDRYLELEEYLPEDGEFWRQWGLKNTAQFTGGVAGSDIEATLAWDRSLGDPSVVVAVIDTGVDYRHPDLAANMWRNPGEIAGNGLDDDANGYVDDVFGIDGQASTGDPMDRHGHGSHCAGVIAAANNGMGTVGVAPRARVMALKADSVDDQGQTVLEESALVACLDYAVAHGATILSNSYGIYDEEPLAVREAFVRARDAGVLAVTAAGNMGVDTDTVAHYPSRWATTLDNMLAVGATDFADQSAGYSNFGATTVHLFAPGSMIYSTLPESDWGYKSGTSMAAPLVAGTAALLQAHRPGLSPRDSRDRMVASAEPLAILTGRCLSGGRLNARRALDCEPTPTPSVAPSPSPSPSVAPSPSPSPTPGPFRSGALALVPGWNLVGLPVARVESLTLGEGVSTPFFAYHPGLSAYIQVPATPESLDAGQGTARGFWVFAAQATTLEYAGSGDPPRDVSLAAGWNLVASPAFRVAESGFSAEGSDRVALADAVCPTWPAPDGCLAYSKAFRYDPDIAAYRSDDLAATNTQVPEAWGFWMYCHTPMTMHLVPPVEDTGFRRNRQ